MATTYKSIFSRWQGALNWSSGGGGGGNKIYYHLYEKSAGESPK